MKLRHMTAEVVELEDVVIEENRHGEKIYHVYDSVKALKSYDSIVAMATSEDIFMLPRYDYSPATWKHVHAFIQDCTSFTDLCASDMRRAFTDGSCCYHYAEGFDMGVRPWYSEKNELVWVSTCSNRVCEYERHTYWKRGNSRPRCTITTEGEKHDVSIKLRSPRLCRLRQG